MKDPDIDIVADAIVILMAALMRLNDTEITRFEFEESLRSAARIMEPIIKRREKELGAKAKGMMN